MNKTILSTLLVLTILGGCDSKVSPNEYNSSASVTSNSDTTDCVIVSTTGNNSPAIGNLGGDNKDNKKCATVSTTGNNSPAIGSMNNSSITYK